MTIENSTQEKLLEQHNKMSFLLGIVIGVLETFLKNEKLSLLQKKTINNLLKYLYQEIDKLNSIETKPDYTV